MLRKGKDDSSRDPKMKTLIRQAGNELVRKRFESTEELLSLLNASLIQYLRDSGHITTRDFDATPCEGVGLDAISPDKVREFLERAGTGTLDMIRLCAEAGLPEPEFRNEGEHFVIVIQRLPPQVTSNEIHDGVHQVTHQVTHQVRTLLMVVKGEMTRAELMKKLKLHDRVTFRTGYLNPALEKSFIEMTQPDSPRSPTQKYRLTDRGRKIIVMLGKDINKRSS